MLGTITLSVCTCLKFSWSNTFRHFGNGNYYHRLFECAGITARLTLSLKYAAPETITALEAGCHTIHVDAAVDIWAIGVIAFELLTGERAFQVRTPYVASYIILRSMIHSYVVSLCMLRVCVEVWLGYVRCDVRVT